MDIQDVLYGTIHVPNDISLIMETPQFQRLLKIKQLGTVHTWCAGGNHTRYDHCFGTYFLAKRMLNCLEKNTSWLHEKKLPFLYRSAVEIAGLLHDIGHGPFSHFWEQINVNFHHEENAVPLIDAIFDTIDQRYFLELRKNNNYGIELIKALILGEPSLLPTPAPNMYRFIFEIINNKQCLIDVDKWDYLNRDKYYLQTLNTPDTDFDDVFLYARASNDGAHIEYRFKDFHKIYKIFVARAKLHEICYRCPRNLLNDILLKIIIQRCPKKFHDEQLNEITAHDMTIFLELNDENVLNLVKDDPLYKFIEFNEKVTKYEIEDETESEVLTNKNKSFAKFYVEDCVVGPGKMMPNDSKFYLYGDESEKQTFVRDTELITLKDEFLLLL